MKHRAFIPNQYKSFPRPAPRREPSLVLSAPERGVLLLELVRVVEDADLTTPESRTILAMRTTLRWTARHPDYATPKETARIYQGVLRLIEGLYEARPKP